MREYPLKAVWNVLTFDFEYGCVSRRCPVYYINNETVQPGQSLWQKQIEIGSQILLSG